MRGRHGYHRPCKEIRVRFPARHMIREVRCVYRDAIFGDFSHKLADVAGPAARERPRTSAQAAPAAAGLDGDTAIRAEGDR